MYGQVIIYSFQRDCYGTVPFAVFCRVRVFFSPLAFVGPPRPLVNASNLAGLNRMNGGVPCGCGCGVFRVL